MKTRMKLLVTVLVISLFFAGCSQKKQEGKVAQVEEKPTTTTIETKAPTVAPTDNGNSETMEQGKEKQIIMVYMVGSNLESEAGLATIDIQEMMESQYNSNNVQLLLCTGGASQWFNYTIPSDKCMIYELDGSKLNQIYELKNKNMASPDTLTEFLDYSYDHYKGSQYGIIFWNHGGGAIVGYGADENYENDTLTIHEMDQAFSDCSLCNDMKFEWMGFDACLMGMLEVANMASNYSKFLIGSEEVEAGTGWNYQFLSKASEQTKMDGKQTAQYIIDSYYDFCETQFDYAPDYTLSCLDLSRTDQVIDSFDTFIKTAEASLKEGGYSKIAKIRDDAKSFGKISELSFYDTVDLYDLAENMKLLYNEEAINLQKEIKDYVIYQRTNIPNAYGIAIYFPYENKKYAKEWIEEYSQTEFSETYVTFMREFVDTLNGEQIAQWDIAETVPTEDEEQSGNYFVQLTKKQAQNYSRANYQIWQEDSENSYICWILSNDVTLSDNGKLSAAFKGKQFYVEDSSGESLKCCAVEIDRAGKNVTYAVPLIHTNSKGAIKAVYAHVKVTPDYPNGILVGVYNTLNPEESIIPDKKMVKFDKGDFIQPFYFARDIVFNKDETVAPFEQWKSTSGLGGGFKFAGGLKISMKKQEEKQKYCCLFQVTDTQQNSYYTNPIFITQ